MFHAGDIINQSRPFDKNTIIDKFSDLVHDLHSQFKLEHLDRLILSVGRDISDIDVSNNIIDGIVNSRCNSLKKNVFQPIHKRTVFYFGPFEFGLAITQGRRAKFNFCKPCKFICS